jgi:stage II sporulation protein D
MSRWRSLTTLPVVACLVATGLSVTQLTAGPATSARAASGCFPAGGQQVPSAPAPASAGIIVQGHGWGHGLGMSQYGARGAALLGCNHGQILGTYYAGTHLKRQGMTAPVVLALRSGVRATVTAENGNVVWATPAGTKRVQPKGQTWTAQAVNRNGVPGTGLLDAARRLQMWISKGTLTVNHPGITVRLRTFNSGSATPSMDKRLRWGTARFTRSGGGLAVEEAIGSDKRGRSVDKYLWGLGEVPVSWPAEALRAQADAARTYLTGSFSSGAYRIGTTTAAQVYTGATREDEDIRYGSRWRAAVNATSGEVIADALGAPITAMYSSSDGGRSESRAYVYGDQGGYGYLTSVDDSRWDLASSNPYRSWAKAFTPEEFAAALGFSSVSGVSLAGPGTDARRAGLQVTGVIGGVSRTVSFTGAAARSALGLRSSAFTISWAQPAPIGPTALEVQPLAGDWDGDGKDEFGVFRAGQVSLRMADGTVTRYLLGRSGDVAVVGDWDDDGKDSVGMFRSGTWYLRNALSAGPFDRTFSFGAAGYQPVTGKWAGRGHQGIGVVRGAHWYLRTSVTPGPAERTFIYGIATDRALAGDWNGDGSDTPGVFRSGVFYLRWGLDSGNPLVVRFGRSTDAPVVGDFDGTGGDTTGVYRGQTLYYRNDLAGGVGTAAVTLPG